MSQLTESANLWAEYDAAAAWCAQRGIAGKLGDWLPENISTRVMAEIDADPESFERRVRDHAYALAMNALNLPDVPDELDEDPAMY